LHGAACQARDIERFACQARLADSRRPRDYNSKVFVTQQIACQFVEFLAAAD
jgi:hypothetical protein